MNDIKKCNEKLAETTAFPWSGRLAIHWFDKLAGIQHICYGADVTVGDWGDVAAQHHFDAVAKDVEARQAFAGHQHIGSGERLVEE